MSRPRTIVGLMLLAGMSLAACNRNKGDDILANDPLAATSTRQEDQFGKGFGKAYRADPNSEPANLVAGDMIPVSTTAEPIVID